MKKPVRLSLLSVALTRVFGRLMPHAFDANDPEVKAAITAAVEEATQGLKAKNAELLGEVKKLKAGREIQPEDLAKVERERDELAARVTTLEKDVKTAQKAAKDATEALEGEKGYTSRLLIDNGLNAALIEAGVKNPAHLKAAAALIRTTGQVEIKADGDNRAAMIGGKPLVEFVKAWAQSDDGKHFVSAPSNTGSGARGNTGNAQPVNSDLSKLSPVERMHQAREAAAAKT